MNKRMTSEALSSALVRAQQGHKDVWDPIFEELQRIADRLVRRILQGLPHQEHAENVQQVLTYLWEERNAWITSYDQQQDAIPYVSTLIRRKTYRILRNRTAKKRQGMTVAFDDAEDLEERHYVWHELDEAPPDMDPDLAKLAQYMERLSDRDREIVVRRGLHEESYQEIGKDLKLSENTTTQNFKRALKKLAKMLGHKAEWIALILLPLFSALTCL